jgi:competence protein ComEA
LPPGSLVKDAIVMAGGFTVDANPVVLNQALTVRDGDHIHVPTMVETAETPPVLSGEAEESVRAPDSGGGIVGALININTASLGELEDLPGIGPALAQSIVDYREATGPFETIEDIMKVSGIGTAKFEAMRDLITVGN